MPKPYPKELRERVVAAYRRGGAVYEEIAARFDVGRATVDRWLALERKTGSVSPKRMGGARRERKVDSDADKFIGEILDVLPDCTLGELADALERERGVRVHERTMGRNVARLGYTRKRGVSGLHKPTARTS